MKAFICQICGHIEFHEAAETCPVCTAPKEKFVNNNNIFKESEEKSPEASIKHIPAIVVEKKCGLIPEAGCVDIHVRIGETLHPMEEKHFIQFIDCYIDDKYAARAQLSANGVNPATAFHLKVETGKVTIVENCNIHGYWKTEVAL